MGCFLSPDSIVPDPGNPQALNRYSYVNNNPVNGIDPSGHFSFGSFIKSFAKIVIPIVTVVASMVATAAGQAWAVPLIAGVGSGAQTAVNGGNMGQILVSAMVGAVAAGVGLEVASAGGSTIGSLTSPTIGTASGAVVGAGAGGFVQGLGSGLVMGANWDTAFRRGYQTAAFAGGTAAVAAAASAYYHGGRC